MTTIEKILDLQERDRRLRQLSQELTDIPARQKLVETRLQQHRDSVKQAQDALNHNLSAIKQVELDVDARQTRIRKFLDEQTKVKNNDQYRALDQEIRSLRKQIREIEEREIKLMEEGEILKARVDELKESLSREEKGVGTDVEALGDRLSQISSERGALQAERDEMAKDIDEEWLSRYDRIFRNKGDFALVPVENASSCGGCHMRLPPQSIQDVKRATAMVSCSYCGRLLYWMD
ncbi:MAG: hypothetical protein H7A43_09555 [Verrucomicrobia bacterium]|nr:hypothetical protein [Verrucomicrobiota bacterium]